MPGADPGSDRARGADFLLEMRKNCSVPKSPLLAFLIKELRELVPPPVFFAVGFNLIVLTTKLILAGNEADAARIGFARSSDSAGESRYTPRMSFGPAQ